MTISEPNICFDTNNFKLIIADSTDGKLYQLTSVNGVLTLVDTGELQ